MGVKFGLRYYGKNRLRLFENRVLTIFGLKEGRMIKMIKEGAMGRACSTHRTKAVCIESFGGKTRRNVTTTKD
jgi:hypothetical protein